ncbi:uncharacterized protein PpBr36_10139 [Pyricularia pennisetigena]|uniref:uncharacterized protein n=1 Tax=Pyricularia pennisetigena TaxID=1578925 RepID=UPI001150C545|nr:uncharacterized protein PpBr36_10139 [Pyricularia pennisetigena]TLS21596.1 hypothetical protein PpBr36_10139 [Pyricularia pennisetigena]
MQISKAILALLAPALAVAVDAPGYSGFTRIWQDNFMGSSGTLPDEGKWNIIDRDIGVNNELQTYRRSTRNIQLSGGQSLQLVPWRDSSARGGWSSGRAESRYVLTPPAGRVTRVEAKLRFGPNSPGNKQGIWPAFWMLGDSMRHGTPWPACGELDIMETVNGILTGHGTTHCDVYPGGACNEPSGIGAPVSLPNQDAHVWRLDIDRRAGRWQDETITWFLDGKQFHQISGNRIGNERVWTSLARSPLYIILNLAVGGDWPGYPNGNTLEGWGQMMEVFYVAHYQSTALQDQRDLVASYYSLCK